MTRITRLTAVTTVGLFTFATVHAYAEDAAVPDTGAPGASASAQHSPGVSPPTPGASPSTPATDMSATAPNTATNGAQTGAAQAAPTNAIAGAAEPGEPLPKANEGTPTADADNADGKRKKGKKGKKRKKGNQPSDAPAEQTGATGTDQNDLVGDFMAGDPWGNTKGALRANGLTFRFLLQGQYQHTFGVDSKNPDTNYRIPENTLAREGDGWDVSRIFFGVTAEPSKYLHLKVLTDFAEFKKSRSSRAVKQAYAELRPIPKHLHFAVGVLKLPFSIHELDPIATYEFTSSGRTNALLNNLDIAGRDIGAEVMVSPLDKPSYLKLTLGAYRGHASDENASPVGNIGARAESEPVPGLRVGAGLMRQPKDIVKRNVLNTSGDDLLPNPENPAYPRAETWKKGSAFGLDVTYRLQGFSVRGEGLLGNRVDYDTRYGADRWAAVWGIVAYKFDAGPVKLEPAIRVEYLDTNFEHSGGLYRQYTFGLGTHFNAATKLIIDVTRMMVESNTPYIDQPKPLREVPYNAIDATTLTGRLQVVL